MLKFGIQISSGIMVKILLLYSDRAQQRVKMSTRLKDFLNSVRNMYSTVTIICGLIYSDSVVGAISVYLRNKIEASDIYD